MGMTIEYCAKMLIAKEKCMSRETSGTDIDCNSHNCDNCDLCYEQGTMGEQREALRFAVDIMCKYQKIEELYDYWRSGKCEYTISCMENIGKVLKNGNDD